MSEASLRIPQDIKTGPFFRTIGRAQSGEVLGAGFMHKPGVKVDHADYIPRRYSLVYVIQGQGRYWDAAGRCWDLRAGDYFQRIPGCRHTTELDPQGDWWECFIDLGQGLFEVMLRMNVIEPERPVGRLGISQAWVDCFHGLVKDVQAAPEYALPALVPRMLDLLTRILRQRSGRGMGRQVEDMIFTACEQLDNDPAGTLSVPQLCAQYGWGYESFRKAFRKSIGISPGQYRLRRRIDHARRLLKSRPDLNIGMIADRLGYKNVYEFSAQFRRYTGLPPRRFREGS